MVVGHTTGAVSAGAGTASLHQTTSFVVALTPRTLTDSEIGSSFSRHKTSLLAGGTSLTAAILTMDRSWHYLWPVVPDLDSRNS